MAVLLSVTTTPQSFTAGTFNAAAAAMNNGISRFTFTPTAASTTYAGGNFHILFGQDHGGLWLNDANLELYDTPSDNLAFTQPLTWLAGQPITVKIDSQSGTRAVTISGATTGNGTFTFSIAGPYYNTATTLDSGRYTGGGATFDFVGTISDIDDAVTSDTVSPAVITVIGSSVSGSIGFKAAVSAATITLVGGSVSEGTSGQSDGVTPASITVVGGTITTKRAYAVAPIPASIAVVGGNVTESRGGLISLGPTALDFQKFSFADRPSNVTMTTPVSGAVVLLCAGGNNTDLSTTWTDNKNAADPVTVGALVSYPDFAGYGTIVAMTPAPMTGGTSHTFTQQVGAGDENTTFALTAIVAGGHPRVTEVHNNVDNATGTTQQTSPTINIDDEALLIAFWWGSSPVVPPFSTPSPGIGTPFTATPDNGFTVAESYLINNEFGEVQGAMAYLYVPAGGGPSARSVTWTHSPAQGAQLRLVAVQPALSEAPTPALIALVGQSVGERIAYQDIVTPAALAVTGGTIIEGILRMDTVVPAQVVLAGGSVLDQVTFIESVLPAALSIVGGTVQDQINVIDGVTPAAVAISGSVIQPRLAIADVVTPAAILVVGGNVVELVPGGEQDAVSPAFIALVGGIVPVAIAWRVAVQPAGVLLPGGQILARVARKDSVGPAVMTVLGGNVQDLVTSGAQDAVTPAALTLLGTIVQTRMTYVVPIVPAAMSLHGSEVQTQVGEGASATVPPIPPGRAASKLEGRVVVPSIESRESEQAHLFGMVRSKNDV